MSHKKTHAEHHAAAPKPAPEAEAPVPGAAPESAPAELAGAPGARSESGAAPAGGVDAAVAGEVERLAKEVADLKDRLLRTAADFDNFKKRAAREKAETWGRAQADLILKVLDGLDDLGRVAHLDPAQTSAESLHEGVGLVERKVLKALEGVGLERLDPSGQAFDPNAHEAVMTTPATDAGRDGQVAMVFQAGYRLNGFLLRPARVAVYAFAESPPTDVVQ